LTEALNWWNFSFLSVPCSLLL